MVSMKLLKKYSFFLLFIQILYANEVGVPFIPLGHSKTINIIDANKTILISGSEDSSIKVWDLKRKKLIKTFDKHKVGIKYVKLIYGTNFVLSIDKSSKLYLWDIRTMNVFKEHTVPMKYYTSIALIPNTAALFITDMEKTILFNVTDTKEHNLTYRLPEYTNMSNFALTVKKHKKVLLNIYKQKLALYNLESNYNKSLELSIPYAAELSRVALSPNLRYIAASFKDKQLHIYSAKDGKTILTIETNYDSDFNTLIFTPSSDYIALVDRYTVTIWNVNTSKKVYSLSHDEQIAVNTFTFIDDENYVIGSNTGEIKYINLKEKKEIGFSTYTGMISKVAFSSDGKKIYASNNQNHVTDIRPRKYYSILNYKTKEESKLFHNKHEGIVTASKLSSNYFVTAHFNGSIGIWDINRKIKLKEKKLYKKSIQYLDISKNEKMLAVSTNLGKINILDLTSLKELFTFDNNQEFSQGLRFSPDGRYLLYVSSYNFKVWTTSDWELKLDEKIAIHTSPDIRFKDNYKLVLLDNAKSIVQYDIDTQEKIVLYDIKKFLQERKLWSEYDYIKYYTFSHNANQMLLSIKGETFIVDIKLKQGIKIKTPFKTDEYMSKVFHFNFDNSLIGCVDNSTLHLWDTKTGKKKYSYKLYSFKPSSVEIFSSKPYGDIEVSFSLDKHLIASTTAKTHFPSFTSDAINVWDVKESKVIQNLNATHYTTKINDFTLDGNKTLYSASTELTLMDASANTIEKGKYQKLSKEIMLKGYGYSQIKKVASLSDRYMVMLDAKIVLIDKKDLKIVKTIKPLSGKFTSAIISSDDKEIITTSYDINKGIVGDYNDSLVVYDSESGNIIFKTSSFGANVIAYSQDKKLFAIGTYPRPIIINIDKNSSVLLKEHDNIISSIEICKESSLIATGGYDNKVRLFNSNTGELIYTFEGHGGAINSIAFHPSKPFLISGSSDGTVKYWDIERKKLIATFISFEDKWITLTPEGFFNASSDAAQKLNILYDDMTIGSMRNMFDTFFRPDLVKLKLRGEDISLYTKNINLMSIIENKPPCININKTNNYTDKEKVTISFRVKEDNGGGVGLIRIYQEGKLIQTIGEGKIAKSRKTANVDIVLDQEKLDKTMKLTQSKYIAEQKKEEEKIRLSLFSKSARGILPIEETIAKVQPKTTTNKEGTYDLEIELKSGKNEISIEAFNKTNTVTSYRENITINANIPKQKPKLYAIVAGVNEFEFKNKELKLKYSENDAKDIREVAEEKMKTVFDDVEVIYLAGKEVTKVNILKAAQTISKKAKLDDTVFFYISTHGRAVRGKLYLVPYNNKLGKNWIDFEQTFQAVQSIKALNQIFIIDACESGKANDIVSSVYDSRASVLAKSSGVHMLLATTKGTSAFEHPDKNIKNGVFTYRILEALKNKTIDTNKDNFISILELSKKLKEPVNNADYQYPVIRNVGKDVELERVVE